MVFSSPIFLFVFLPLCIICYMLAYLSKRILVNNVVLLIFSVLFYAYGSLEFLPILLLSIIINYTLSYFYVKSNNSKYQKSFFWASIIFNLGLLFVYKYLNLFSGLILGSSNASNIKLPIGISFYTFQVLSYHIDVYRRDVKRCENILDFALFTMLFPQLIAGPIVRYNTIEKELKYRTISLNNISDGLVRFMVGFAKKIIFANKLGHIADLAFSHLEYYNMGFFISIIAIMCYSIQIYLDFSAYSDMAIGIGHIFGFSFPENFNLPFTSKSISELWKRWHITLSTFFRDYVYIPLGGSRKGLVRTCINLVIVFALSGFWHGASFNFLFWGLFNAFFLVIERIIREKTKFHLDGIIGIIYVFIIWNVGMIIFRFDNLNTALLYLKGLISPISLNFYSRTLLNELFSPYFIMCFLISILYLTPFFDKIYSALYKTRFGFIIIDVVVVSFFVYAIMEMLTTGFNPFIYFRF